MNATLLDLGVMRSPFAEALGEQDALSLTSDRWDGASERLGLAPVVLRLMAAHDWDVDRGKILALDG